MAVRDHPVTNSRVFRIVERLQEDTMPNAERVARQIAVKFWPSYIESGSRKFRSPSNQWNTRPPSTAMAEPVI